MYLIETFYCTYCSLQSKIETILRATYIHATNLARFVFIYKCIKYLIKQALVDLKEYHTFIAAFITGYYVFGDKNNVNEQVRI